MHSAYNLSKNAINARFKRLETRLMFSGVFPFFDTKTQSKTIYYPETALSAALHSKQTAFSGLHTSV